MAPGSTGRESGNHASEETLLFGRGRHFPPCSRALHVKASCLLLTSALMSISVLMTSAAQIVSDLGSSPLPASHLLLSRFAWASNALLSTTVTLLYLIPSTYYGRFSQAAAVDWSLLTLMWMPLSLLLSNLNSPHRAQQTSSSTTHFALLLVSGVVVDLPPAHLLLQLLAMLPFLCILQVQEICSLSAAARLALHAEAGGQFPLAGQPNHTTRMFDTSSHAAASDATCASSASPPLLPECSSQGIVAHLLDQLPVCIVCLAAAALAAEVAFSRHCTRDSELSQAPNKDAGNAGAEGDVRSAAAEEGAEGMSHSSDRARIRQVPDTKPSFAVPLESLGLRVLPLAEGGARGMLAAAAQWMDEALGSVAVVVSRKLLVGLVGIPAGVYFLALAFLARHNLWTKREISLDEGDVIMVLFFLLGRESCKLDVLPFLAQYKSHLSAARAVLSDLLPGHIVKMLIHEAGASGRGRAGPEGSRAGLAAEEAQGSSEEMVHAACDSNSSAGTVWDPMEQLPVIYAAEEEEGERGGFLDSSDVAVTLAPDHVEDEDVALPAERTSCSESVLPAALRSDERCCGGGPESLSAGSFALLPRAFAKGLGTLAALSAAGSLKTSRSSSSVATDADADAEPLVMSLSPARPCPPRQRPPLPSLGALMAASHSLHGRPSAMSSRSASTPLPIPVPRSPVAHLVAAAAAAAAAQAPASSIPSGILRTRSLFSSNRYSLSAELPGPSAAASAAAAALAAQPATPAPISQRNSFSWGRQLLGDLCSPKGTTCPSYPSTPAYCSPRGSYGGSGSPTTGPSLKLAESHSCLTVFFSDIVGFSSWAHKLSPEKVMGTLNDLYTRLDDIIIHEMPNLYKVETIGDAYMVAGNLSSPDPAHAANMVRFALRAQQEAAKVQRPDLDDGTPLQLRIGLHSGAAMSGIVGKLRRRFCIFGDTVNMASRTETCCPQGCVQVTAATRALALPYLGRQPGHGGVVFQERGEVELKGAQLPVVMYLVEPSTEGGHLRTM